MADKSGLYITLIVGLVALVGLLILLGNKGTSVTGNVVVTTQDYKFGERSSGYHIGDGGQAAADAGDYVGPRGIGSDGAWNVEDSGKNQYTKVRSVATTTGEHATTVENEVCVDKDEAEGENAPYVKSYAQRVVIDERYGGEETKTPRYVDKCKDRATLLEYSCSNDQIAREEITCETGCGNGVCF